MSSRISSSFRFAPGRRHAGRASTSAAAGRGRRPVAPPAERRIPSITHASSSARASSSGCQSASARGVFPSAYTMRSASTSGRPCLARVRARRSSCRSRRSRSRRCVYAPTGQCSTSSSGIGKSVGLPVANRPPTECAAAATRQSACASVRPRFENSRRHSARPRKRSIKTVVSRRTAATQPTRRSSPRRWSRTHAAGSSSQSWPESEIVPIDDSISSQRRSSSSARSTARAMNGPRRRGPTRSSSSRTSSSRRTMCTRMRMA